jgi:chromosome segregation ATPase
VKADRELLAARQARIDALEEQLAAAEKNGASLDTSYKLAQGEIAQLRESIGYLQRAIQLHEQSVKLLQDQNGELTKKLKKSRRQTAFAAAAAIIQAIVRIAL